jgi:hypothetical protein
MKKLFGSAFVLLLLSAAAQAQNSTQFNSGFISATQRVSVPSSGLATGNYSRHRWLDGNPDRIRGGGATFAGLTAVRDCEWQPYRE